MTNTTEHSSYISNHGRFLLQEENRSVHGANNSQSIFFYLCATHNITCVQHKLSWVIIVCVYDHPCILILGMFSSACFYSCGHLFLSVELLLHSKIAFACILTNGLGQMIKFSDEAALAWSGHWQFYLLFWGSLILAPGHQASLLSSLSNYWPDILYLIQHFGGFYSMKLFSSKREKFSIFDNIVVT